MFLKFSKLLLTAIAISSVGLASICKAVEYELNTCDLTAPANLTEGGQLVEVHLARALGAPS